MRQERRSELYRQGKVLLKAGIEAGEGTRGSGVEVQHRGKNCLEISHITTCFVLFLSVHAVNNPTELNKIYADVS